MVILSAAAIERLRARATNPSVGEFERDWAAFRINVNECSNSAASVQVEEFARKFFGLSNNYEAVLRIVSVCIAKQLFGLAEAMIERSGLLSSFKVAFSICELLRHRRSNVRLSVGQNRELACEFDSDLFATEHAEMYVSRLLCTFPILSQFLSSPHFESGCVDLSLDDHGIFPGLSFCDRRPHSFLLPDPSFLRSAGYKSTREHYHSHPIDWEARLPVAMWRGSTSGHQVNEALGWRSLPRVRLCEVAQQRPELFDVGISGISQIIGEEAVDAVRASGFMREPIPMSKFNLFKYQIDIDGNTNSWPGLFQKLLTASPVLKITSEGGWRQWYYDRLVPWVNYVPVTAEMGDLVEKVEWLFEHDEVAREIGRQGQALAHSLDYDGELQRAVPTVAAAVRYKLRRPEHSVTFGVDCNGNGCLRHGWAKPDEDVVWADGFESALEIGKPICREDYVITFDISPWPHMPEGSPSKQALVFIVNGEVLHRVDISERRTISFSIKSAGNSLSRALSVTILHPNAYAAACMSRPLDRRLASIGLHALSLAPASSFDVKLQW